MKISLAILFLVLVIVIQLGTSNVLSKRDTQKELSSDENGIQNGSDVIMAKPGSLDVVLTNGSELVFQICEQNCNAEFLVCYESDINGSFSTRFCDSKCGFYVNTNDYGDIIFMNPFASQAGGRPKKNCTEMLMVQKRTVQFGINYNTCLPKIENGIVKLTIMNATDECLVSIKNAKIKRYDAFTQAGNSPDSRDGSDDTSAANYVGNLGWIFVLISFCILYH